MMFQLHIFFVPLKVATLGFGSFGELPLVPWAKHEYCTVQGTRNQRCHSIYLTHWTPYPIRHLTQCHCAYCPVCKIARPTTHLALQGSEPVQVQTSQTNAVKHASRPNPGSQAHNKKRKRKKKAGRRSSGVRASYRDTPPPPDCRDRGIEARIPDEYDMRDRHRSFRRGPCMTRHADSAKGQKANARGHGLLLL